MKNKFNIWIIIVSAMILNQYDLDSHLDMAPFIFIKNIYNIEYQMNSDSLLIYYDINKCYFNDNQLYYTLNDTNDVISIFNFENELLYAIDNEGKKMCFPTKRGRFWSCANFLAFKNFGVIIKENMDSVQVVESFDFSKNNIRKFELNDYVYIGSDSVSPYFAFVNDSTASKINEIRIIKLNKDGTDTMSVNIYKYINLIQSQKDSVIKIHYFDNDFFIYDDSLAYQSVFLKKKIKLITDSIINFGIDSIYFTSSFNCVRYNNSLIFIGWKLKKLKNSINAVENIIQLFENGSYRKIFEVNENDSLFVPYGFRNILEIHIKKDFLIINYRDPIYINEKSFSNRIIIYDMKKEKLIYKPIKYIDISN